LCVYVIGVEWNPRSYVVEDLLVVLCLADRTPVEVEWQTPLVRFRAFLYPGLRLEWFEKMIS
jgi:hypothetical protein